MVALGYLAQATLGTTTVADGLACTAQTVPNMTVNVGPGSITLLSTVDGTAFGSLPLDNVDPLVKVGINLTPTVLTLTAPTTSGQSINYLIEAAFQEADLNPVVLPYYNAASPSVPFSGPSNSGAAQNTQRLQRVNIQAKAGTPASTGTQATPAPDSGFVGLYVVTVAYAAAAVVQGNISTLASAPFIPAKLGPSLVPGFSRLQTFTSSGAFTVPAGVTRIKLTGVGGGGGGGGIAAVGGSTYSSAPGGNGGSAGIGIFTVAPGATYAVTIGGGGTYGGAGGGAGSGGGTTSFGALLSCLGGQGGGGNAAAVSSGSFSIAPTPVSRQPSGAQVSMAETSAAASQGSSSGNVFGGAGGAGLFGGGGGGAVIGSNTQAAGNTGVTPGSGGGGAAAGGVSTSGNIGGAGAAGIMIVEY